MRISVCIATYDRPQGLQRVLAGIAAQEVPVALAEGLRVLVVDNSPDGGALPVVDGCGPDYPWPLHYVHARRPGISQARNAALDHTEGSEFIVFIDDDELPAGDWLRRLADCQVRHRADVVAGPVLPRFERPPPRWLVAGRFFEPPRRPDGAPVETVYSGNVMFRRALAAGLGLRFSEQLGLIGGEDVDFFDRLKAAGAVMRYCDTALVEEFVPPERARLSWLLRRWLRTGNSEGIFHLDRRPGPRTRLILAARGLLRIAAGLAGFLTLAPLGGLGRPHRAVARLYTLSRGVGMCLSACSIHYREYARPRPRSSHDRAMDSPQAAGLPSAILGRRRLAGAAPRPNGRDPRTSMHSP